MELTTEQLLFGEIEILIEDTLGYTVYPSLPDLDAEYPFVVMGSVQTVQIPDKTHHRYKFFVNLDVWGDDNNRADVSMMATKIRESLRYFKAENLHFKLVQHDVELRTDNSTSSQLWRGLLFLEFIIL